MNLQLDVLAESFVELVEIVLVLRNLLEQVEALLDDILADDLENLVLLQRLSESTMPRTKLRYSGMMSSESSIIKKSRLT